MNLIVWFLSISIVHVFVESHAISCDDFTEQGDVQMQSAMVESFDFTWSEIEGNDEVHNVHVMLSLMFDGTRIVDVDEWGMC